MLKGVPSILPPELVMLLDEMGHGDVLCIADANFPAESVGENSYVVRCDGHGGAELLEAILKLVPIDQYEDHPVTLMEKVPGDTVATPIWDTYADIVSKNDKRGVKVIDKIDRFAFYGEAAKSYVLIASGERAQYANIMVKKGVVFENEEL